MFLPFWPALEAASELLSLVRVYSADVIAIGLESHHLCSSFHRLLGALMRDRDHQAKARNSKSSPGSSKSPLPAILLFYHPLVCLLHAPLLDSHPQTHLHLLCSLRPAARSALWQVLIWWYFTRNGLSDLPSAPTKCTIPPTSSAPSHGSPGQPSWVLPYPMAALLPKDVPLVDGGAASEASPHTTISSVWRVVVAQGLCPAQRSQGCNCHHVHDSWSPS